VASQRVPEGIDAYSRLDILPQAAHLSNIEQPQPLDRALAEFLPT
jgi:pimeloyl-ACP methyl ester carboxylesterase